MMPSILRIVFPLAVFSIGVCDGALPFSASEAAAELDARFGAGKWADSLLETVLKKKIPTVSVVERGWSFGSASRNQQRVRDGADPPVIDSIGEHVSSDENGHGETTMPQTHTDGKRPAASSLSSSVGDGGGDRSRPRSRPIPRQAASVADPLRADLAWADTFGRLSGLVEERVRTISRIGDALEELAPLLAGTSSSSSSTSTGSSQASQGPSDAAAAASPNASPGNTGAEAVAFCDGENLSASCRSGLVSDPRFPGAQVTFGASSVKVAPGVDRTTEQFRRALALSAAAESLFRRDLAADADDTLRWQYFGSSAGLVSTYPGFAWAGSAGYDNRLRPWYLASSAPPRDVVILFPRPTVATRWEAVQAVVSDVLASLSTRDSVAIVAYSGREDNSAVLVTCNGGNTHTRVTDIPAGSDVFERATDRTRAVLTERLRVLSVRSPVSMKSERHDLAAARRLLAAKRGAAASEATAIPCVQSVVWVYPAQHEFIGSIEPLETAAAGLASDGVRVSAFAVRNDPDATSAVGTSAAKAVACAAGGIFLPVNTGLQTPVRTQIAAFHQMWAGGVASGLDASSASRALWTSPYVDAFGLGAVVTIATAVYDKSINPPALLGVLGADVVVQSLRRPVLFSLPSRAVSRSPGSPVAASIVDRVGDVLSHDTMSPARMQALLDVAGAPDIRALESQSAAVVSRASAMPIATDVGGEPGDDVDVVDDVDDDVDDDDDKDAGGFGGRQQHQLHRRVNMGKTVRSFDSSSATVSTIGDGGDLLPLQGTPSFDRVRAAMYAGQCPSSPLCGAGEVLDVTRVEWARDGSAPQLVRRGMRYYIAPIGSRSDFYGVLAFAGPPLRSTESVNTYAVPSPGWQWVATRNASADGGGSSSGGGAISSIAYPAPLLQYGYARDQSIAGLPIDTGSASLAPQGYQRFTYLARHIASVSLGPACFADPVAAIGKGSVMAEDQAEAARRVIAASPVVPTPGTLAPGVSSSSVDAETVRLSGLRVPFSSSSSSSSPTSSGGGVVSTLVDPGADAAIGSVLAVVWRSRFSSEPCDEGVAEPYPIGEALTSAVQTATSCVGRVRRVVSPAGVQVSYPAVYSTTTAGLPRTDTAQVSMWSLRSPGELHVVGTEVLSATVERDAGSLFDPSRQPWFSAHFAAATREDSINLATEKRPYLFTGASFDAAEGNQWVALATVSKPVVYPGGNNATDPPSFVVSMEIASAALYKTVADTVASSGATAFGGGRCGSTLRCMAIDPSGFVVTHASLDSFARRRGKPGRVFLGELEPLVTDLLVDAGVLAREQRLSADGLSTDLSYTVVAAASSPQSPMLRLYGTDYDCPQRRSSELWIYRPQGVDLLLVFADEPFERPCKTYLDTHPPPGQYRDPLSIACAGLGSAEGAPVGCVPFSLREDDIETIFRPEGAQCNPGISRTTEIVIIVFAGIGALLGLLVTYALRNKLIQRRIDRAFTAREARRKEIMERQGLTYPDPIVITGPEIPLHEAARLQAAMEQSARQAASLQAAQEQARARQQFDMQVRMRQQQQNPQQHGHMGFQPQHQHFNNGGQQRPMYPPQQQFQQHPQHHQQHQHQRHVVYYPQGR